MTKKPKVRIPTPPPSRQHKDKSKYDRKAEKHKLRKLLREAKKKVPKPRIEVEGEKS